MSTVFQRTIKASPERLSSEVWELICSLVAPDASSAARKDLDKVAGLAGTIISARYPLNDGIVIYGGGPRVRFYCIYDEAAASGDGAKEEKLAASPTDGDWKMSFPCGKDDLEWLKKGHKDMPARFSIRALGESVEGDEKIESGARSPATGAINVDAFLKK